MSPTHLRRLLLPVATLLLAAPALHAQRESPFMEDFRKLMQIHANDEMAKLVEKEERQAVLAVIETCVAISVGSSDQLETEIQALNKAWKKAFDSKFADLMYTYFALELQGAYKHHRFELIEQYLVKDKEFVTASEERETGRLAALAPEFYAFGEQFTELGDHYMAAQCFRRYAVCHDDGLNGTDKADYRKACEGWGLYLAARDKIDLHDKDYQDAKVRFEKLEFDGYGDPAKGPEARAEAKAAEDASYRATPIGATFEVLADIDALQRPLYTADSNFQVWPSVYLEGLEGTSTFAALEESPAIIRTGANEAVVDLDRDGEGDVELPLTGKITPVRVELGPEKRPWAFLATIGGNQETYQGFRYNMAPDNIQMSLYIAPAGSLVGMIGETPIRVIDENMDGVYGSPPKDWAYFGLAEGAYQHDVDSVVVGEEKFARPWSRLQMIGDAWYELAPTEEGVDLTAKKADVETGTLKLDFKGPKPTWLVVRGTGNNDDLFYDVVNGGKNEVAVPVGSYELYSGLVSKGKKSQMAKALILPGPGMTSWRVQAGEKVEIELGEPFGMTFAFRQDDDTVTVEGRSIVVTGKAGETYQRLWNCVVQPEVMLRKAGSSRGKKEDKLVPAGSQEEFEAQKYDFNTVWFPISEPIEKPQPGSDFEVQLLDKKNKLFGKIESEWQER